MSVLKRPLPIGQQSLPDMIKGDFIYIDKTRIIYDLIKHKNYFFLSRPRRFGKTLLVSTLKEIFLGNQELFKNLYIASTDYAWTNHPVIVISFASITSQSAPLLRQTLNEMLDDIASRYDITIKTTATLGTKFRSLIIQMGAKNKVAILIDEYDAPILKNIENIEVANSCQEVLSDFFSALKDVTVDEYLQFVFITGITNFSKTSIFSGLNNLQDLSLDPRASTLLGYTLEEIKLNHKVYLKEIAKKTNKSIDEILESIRVWYNGYQFVDPAIIENAKVCNPYSVMLYLQHGHFDNYWFDTGTPTFLLRIIKAQNYQVSKIEGSEIHISQTKSYEIKDLELLPLLWQTGYLTIQNYDPLTKNFKLSFPNEEVKVSFYEYIMRELTKIDPALLSRMQNRLSQAITKPDLNTFFETLKIFFAQIPYDIQIPAEKYYQSIFFSIMTLVGLKARAEEHTNDGRIDAVIETKTHILLFEFKLNGSADSALTQIEGKKYYQKYLLSNKTIMLIGVQFDMEQRNITEWIDKEYLHENNNY